MTLLPWMTFFDRNGNIICTVPMRDVIRWQAALVYGPVVIRHYLDNADIPETPIVLTLERMIEMTIDYRIDIENCVIPMN